MVNVAPAAVLPTSNVMPGPVMPRAAIVPALVFDPRSLGNLALWLDARYPNGLGGTAPADGTAVSQWNDLSGNDRHVTQGTGANKPLYRSANPNLLTYNQASVETDTTGLASRGPGFSIARSTAQALHGGASVQVTNAASVTQDDWGVQVGSSGSDYANASAGVTYTAATSVKTPSATGTLTLSIIWRDGAGANLGMTKGTATGTGAWQSLTVTGTAPAGTVYAQLVVSYTIGSAVYYVDQLGLWAGSSTTWVPPVTLPAGMPVVQFDGLNDVLTHGSGLGASARTVYVVTNRDGGTVIGYPYCGGGAGSLVHGVLLASTLAGGFYRDSVGTTLSIYGAPALSGVSVLSVLFNGTTGTSFVNGTQRSTATNGALLGNEALTTLNIGAESSAGASPIAGGVAAVLVFSAAHDTATRQRIERALGRIYGVTVA